MCLFNIFEERIVSFINKIAFSNESVVKTSPCVGKFFTVTQFNGNT